MLSHVCNSLPTGMRPRTQGLACNARPAPALLQSQNRTRIVSCSAASSDPLAFLGVKPDADANEINRAISRLKYEHRGNASMQQKIEAAQSQLMLSALNRRIQGGDAITKEILHADREPLFPWRPRRWDATPKVVMIAGAIQLALAASAFQAPNMSKLIGSMLIGIAGNVMKQNAIAPPPKEPEYATEEEAARPGRNFMRGALLGLLATFAGMILLTAPETIMSMLKVPLPGVLALQPGLLISAKVAGVALSNWAMTAFYY